ncbi:hypothetical protein GCM10027280_27430 [Micromonospora polyrhachis]|uniref:Uncharacterized protein n=1 Tax=Micromonospora polyrhachis TaxID=1282883 RepID=A0A7W7SN58_9ACTN|nr:hypothetical protein [Micromonospora polyrhachis]MBB4957835.1 hypothetical protein [Micromonospora polyrhachis]
MLDVARTAVDVVADRIVAVGTAHTAALGESTVDRLYGVVAVRLSGSPIGGRILRTLEAGPADPVARWDATQAVAAEAEADAGFADALRQLVGQLPIAAAAGDGIRPVDRPARGSGLSQTGIVVGIAVAVVVLVVGAALYLNVVAPYVGLTEGARLDRVAGQWHGQDSASRVVLTINSDGTAMLSNRSRSCVGEIDSPARFEYTIRFDCGSDSDDKATLWANLRSSGDELTIREAGKSDSVVFVRE